MTKSRGEGKILGGDTTVRYNPPRHNVVKREGGGPRKRSERRPQKRTDDGGGVKRETSTILYALLEFLNCSPFKDPYNFLLFTLTPSHVFKVSPNK